MGNLPSARYGHCMEYDQLIIYGGKNSSGAVLNDYATMRNLTSMQWSPSVDATGMTGRYDHTCSIYTQYGWLYAYGGRTASGALTDALKFDTYSLEWTHIGVGSNSYYGHQMIFALNNVIFSIMGYKTNTPVNTVNAIIQPSNGSAIFMTSMGGVGTPPTARYWFGRGYNQCTGDFYVLAGNDAGNNPLSIILSLIFLNRRRFEENNVDSGNSAYCPPPPSSSSSSSSKTTNTALTSSNGVSSTGSPSTANAVTSVAVSNPQATSSSAAAPPPAQTGTGVQAPAPSPTSANQQTNAPAPVTSGPNLPAPSSASGSSSASAQTSILASNVGAPKNNLDSGSSSGNVSSEASGARSVLFAVLGLAVLIGGWFGFQFYKRHKKAKGGFEDPAKNHPRPVSVQPPETRDADSTVVLNGNSSDVPKV